jgi:hypothetical protein
MSIELGNGKTLLGQIASNHGYVDLINAAHHPALVSFFAQGYTEYVPGCIKDLEELAADKKTAKDVASTARGLAKLMQGQTLCVITDGTSNTPNVKESLLHPKHAATLDPARAKLTKMLVRRFNRQERAFMTECPRWLHWLSERYSEAAADEAAKKGQIRHVVTVNIEAGATLTSDAAAADIAIYDAAITAASIGAVQSMSLGAAIKSAKEQGIRYTTAWLKDNGFKKLASDVDDTTRERIADAVADAFAKGRSYDAAVSAIQDVFSQASSVRADMIARTELNDAYCGALLRSAKDGTKYKYKVWTPDGECCAEVCQPNVDAGPIPLDANFPSGDDAPPAHPRCVASGTLVLSSARIAAHTARAFVGEICVLGGPGMDDLSITPNHPVLTRIGWRPAGELKVGDDVFQCCGLNRRVVFHPDYDYVKATVEEIADTLAVSSGVTSRSVPASAEAFHGDAGADGKVDIIYPARAFADGRVGLDGLQESSFGRSDSGRIAFSGESNLVRVLEALRSPSDGPLSRRSLGGTLFRALLAGSDKPGLASATGGKTHEPPASENGATADADAISNSEKTFPIKVRSMKLTKVERRKFDGHVYNLQTDDGFYFANSIIVHNCDCGLEFQEDSEE